MQTKYEHVVGTNIVWEAEKKQFIYLRSSTILVLVKSPPTKQFIYFFWFCILCGRISKNYNFLLPLLLFDLFKQFTASFDQTKKYPIHIRIKDSI